MRTRFYLLKLVISILVMAVMAWVWRAYGNARLWAHGMAPIQGGEAKAASLDPTPSMSRFKRNFGALWRGGLGGAGTGLAMAILGAPLGSLAGGLVVASVIGGDEGVILATLAGKEAVELLFIGGGAEAAPAAS